MLSLKEELSYWGEVLSLRRMCSYEYIPIGGIYCVVYVNVQVL